MFKRFVKSVWRDVTCYCSISVGSMRYLLVGLSVILSVVNKLLSKLVTLRLATGFDGSGAEDA